MSRNPHNECSNMHSMSVCDNHMTWSWKAKESYRMMSANVRSVTRDWSWHALTSTNNTPDSLYFHGLYAKPIPSPADHEQSLSSRGQRSKLGQKGFRPSAQIWRQMAADVKEMKEQLTLNSIRCNEKWSRGDFKAQTSKEGSAQLESTSLSHKPHQEDNPGSSTDRQTAVQYT